MGKLAAMNQHALPMPATGAPRLVEGEHTTKIGEAFAGPSARPRWARPALLGLLAVTAAAYLWNLTSSGYANSFYSAAVQAGGRR